MDNSPVFLRKLTQKNNTQFTIEWSDGKQVDYRLCDLQRACPCAGCVDENTGHRLSKPTQVSDDLRAEKIWSVGRYALRIQFKTGCSNGIYSYTLLRTLQ